MAFYVDRGGASKHVNYEPSYLRKGLHEAPKSEADYHQFIEGHLGRRQPTRPADDYTQAGERYRSFQDWERDDLIANLAADMKTCPEELVLRMVWHFWHCDEDYGRRVAAGAGLDLDKAKACRTCPASRLPAGNARARPTATASARRCSISRRSNRSGADRTVICKRPGESPAVSLGLVAVCATIEARSGRACPRLR